MKKLNLTQEYLKSLLNYCPTTGLFTWAVYRGGKRAGSVAGSTRISPKGKKYTQIKIHCIAFQAHRLAWLYVHGEFPPDQIDHIDGNGLNNKLDNIRAVTAAENAKNQRMPITNTSGIVGVRLTKYKTWTADIKHCGENIKLGSYNDLFSACCARKSAEIRYGFHENHGCSRPL